MEMNFKDISINTGGFWRVNKIIARALGLEVATVLAELQTQKTYFGEKGELQEDGSFFETGKTIQNHTGVTEYGRKKALRILKEKQFIRVKRKKKDGVNFYHIDDMKIIEFQAEVEPQGQKQPNQMGQKQPEAQVEKSPVIRRYKKKLPNLGGNISPPQFNPSNHIAPNPNSNFGGFSSALAKEYFEKYKAKGKTPADFGGMPLEEYAEQRAHADSFKVLETSDLESKKNDLNLEELKNELDEFLGK